MQRRHLITSSFLATLIIVIAGIFLGSCGDDQVSTKTVNRPAPTLEDKARFEQLAAVLNQSATGRYLLDLKEFYRITVQFGTGDGSTFNQDANRILLDANHDVVKAGLYFAHEMHHAITLYQGKKADLKTESRQAYIENKLMEEAEGMAASIQVKIELEEIGVDVTGITLPLEEIYRQAYQDAAYRSTQSAFSLSAQQLDEIGMTAGEQALFGTFANGEIRTSNTHEPYTAYYGHAWDEIHPFKAFVAGLFSQGTPDRISSVLTKPRSDILIGYSGIISAAVTGRALCWGKMRRMLAYLGARRISSFSRAKSILWGFR